MASGLLIILLNKATKSSVYFQSMDKEYIAKLKLGIITDTWDMEGKIIKQKKLKDLNLNEISQVVSSFSGDFYQTPPIFSAKKIMGKPAYYYARSKKKYGDDIKLKKELVKIYEINIISLEEDLLTIKVICSSGTYIRSIAYEIGKKLGCGGALVELTREKIGSYDLKNSIDLEDLELIASGSGLSSYRGIIKAADIKIPNNDKDKLRIN